MELGDCIVKPCYARILKRTNIKKTFTVLYKSRCAVLRNESCKNSCRDFANHYISEK